MKKFWSLLLLWLAASGLSGAPRIRTVLVFPFENLTSRADLSWISESFAEILPSRLQSPTRYVLDRDERMTAFEQLGLAAGPPLTLASELKVAETLGVDWAVVGNFKVDNNRLTVRTRLLDARALKLTPVLEVTGELAELVELQTRLAWGLLAAHDPDFTVGKEEDFRRRFPDIHLDAFENYIRGILAADADSRVRFLTEADRRDPADHRAAFELGRYYFEQKDYSNSGLWLRKLTEKDDNYLESLFLQGVGEFFLGHPPVAERAFAALAGQIPLNEVANNLGVMQSRRGDFAGALANFQRAYQGDLADPDFSFNLGVCFWHLGKYDQAAKALEDALRADDEDPEAHALLGLVFRKMGDSSGEQRELQWLADHEGSPNNPTELTEDIPPLTRLKKNFGGRAFRLLSLTVQNAREEELSALPPGEHAKTHLESGTNLAAAGRLQEAERELAEAAALLPQESEAHLVLAQVYEAEGRHSEAAAELKISLMLKDTAVAHLWLGRVYLSLNRVQAARDQGQAALSMDPANRDAESLIDQIRERSSASRRTP